MDYKNLDKIRIASKSLEHRGPDSSGYFENQDNEMKVAEEADCGVHVAKDDMRLEKPEKLA